MILPHNWIVASWSDIVVITHGQNQKEIESLDGIYPIYGSGGQIGRGTKYLCKAGSIVVGRKGTIDRPFFTQTNFWNIDTAFGITSTEGVLPRYLFAFCQYFDFKTLDHSTGRPSLTQTNLYGIKIPLPPLAEQHRIVAKIDALFSRLDKGVETLQTIQHQLRTYRQAVLKWAFEGKDWEMKPFKEIATSRLGKMLDKKKNIGDLRQYLRNINVRWFCFDCSDLLKMQIEEQEIEKYQIKNGDLLICEGGEPGRCAIWRQNKTIAFQKALHRVRVNLDMSSDFLMYYISCLAATGKLKEYFTGTGIMHLTGESLNKIKVPKPPLNEQTSIVASIESRLSVCDKLEAIVEENLNKAQALKQSILKKAFAGQLVPQDPNDESAEKLLECIKAEKHPEPVISKTARKSKRG